MSAAWVRAAMVKDVLRHARDPLALLLWTGIPLVIGLLITQVAGGSGDAPPTATVWWVDEDDSLISGLLATAAEQAGGMIDVEQVAGSEHGRERLLDDDGTAMLVIPKGFGEAVLRETPTTLTLVTNPSQSILPSIVEETLSIVRDAVFYLHRVLGTELNAFIGESGVENLGDADVARISVSIRQAAEEIVPLVSPPVLSLEMGSLDDAEDDLDASVADLPRKTRIGLILLPGILFMALMFTAQGVSEDVWREQAQGTLRRALSSPRGLGPFLMGKVAAGTLLLGVITTLGLGAGLLYHGVSLTRLPVAVAWAMLGGASLLALMLALQTFATSRTGATILTNSLVFPLLIVGGSFFPFEAMPDGLVAIGAWTPNGMASEGVKSLLLDRAEMSELVRGGLGLLGWIVAGGAVAALRLRARFGLR